MCQPCIGCDAPRDFHRPLVVGCDTCPENHTITQRITRCDPVIERLQAHVEWKIGRCGGQMPPCILTDGSLLRLTESSPWKEQKCGYCKQAFPEVAEVIKNDGNISFVIKEFPILGEQSVLAARFAISVKQNAGDEAYGKIHDAMMTFRGDFNDESLRRLSDQAGLNTAKVMAGMNAPAVDAVLNANHALASTLQIDGTPGFILGGQVLRGYVPHDALVQLVDEARS